MISKAKNNTENKKDEPRCLTHICFVRVSCFIYVFIYVYWCPTWFPYQMMFVSFSSNTTGVACGAGTTHPSGAPDFTPIFVGFVLLLCFVDRCLCFYPFVHYIVCLLRFTASDYSFGIFKFSYSQYNTNVFLWEKKNFQHIYMREMWYGRLSPYICWLYDIVNKIHWYLVCGRRQYHIPCLWSSTISSEYRYKCITITIIMCWLNW